MNQKNCELIKLNFNHLFESIITKVKAIVLLYFQMIFQNCRVCGVAAVNNSRSSEKNSNIENKLIFPFLQHFE